MTQPNSPPSKNPKKKTDAATAARMRLVENGFLDSLRLRGKPIDIIENEISPNSKATHRGTTIDVEVTSTSEVIKEAFTIDPEVSSGGFTSDAEVNDSALGQEDIPCFFLRADESGGRHHS